MRPLNLAETKIRERNRCRREVNRRLRVAVVLVVFCLVVAATAFGCRLSIAANATRLKLQLADVQARCVVVKQEMAQVKLRSGQRSWQKELTNGSKQWLRVAQDVMNRLPADAWIARIESSPQNTSLTLEGGTSSYESLSLYMDRLRRLPRTADVRLSNSKVTVDASSSFVEFALQIRLKPTQVQPANAQPAAAPQAQEAG